MLMTTKFRITKLGYHETEAVGVLNLMILNFVVISTNQPSISDS